MQNGNTHLEVLPPVTEVDTIASSIDNTPFCTEVRNVCETAMRSYNPGKDITELEDKFPCRNPAFF